MGGRVNIPSHDTVSFANLPVCVRNQPLVLAVDSDPEGNYALLAQCTSRSLLKQAQVIRPPRRSHLSENGTGIKAWGGWGSYWRQVGGRRNKLDFARSEKGTKRLGRNRVAGLSKQFSST